MKILYVVHQFFPEHKTGTEVLTKNTAANMKSLGHHVAVFTALPFKNSAAIDDSANTLHHYQYEGINVWCFNHCYTSREDQANMMKQEYNNKLGATLLKQLFLSFKPDLVHVFHFQRITVSIVPVCRDMNIPIVFTPTDFWFMCPTTQLLLPDARVCEGPDNNCVNCLKHLTMIRAPEKLQPLLHYVPDSIFAVAMWMCHRIGTYGNSIMASAMSLAQRADFLRSQLNTLDKIIIPNPLMRRKMLEFGLSDEHFVDIPFAVDFPEASVKTVSSRLRVGFIGTLYHHKGVHVLLDALTAIDRNLPLDVFIYGDTTQFPEYIKPLMMASSTDDRVHWRGIFEEDEINKVFAQIDVLVVPSVWHENTPLVASAALFYGCPIVSSRIEGMKDIVIEGVNGLFFTPTCHDELATILTSLAADREKLLLLSQQSPTRPKVSDYVNQVHSIYHELVNGVISCDV
jgi:glycosyltransferase involved in cell wall biosynthesis